jgi:hypothetical protein
MVAEEMLFPSQRDFYNLMQEWLPTLSTGKLSLSDFNITEGYITPNTGYNSKRWVGPCEEDRKEMLIAIQNMHIAFRDALKVLVKEHQYIIDTWFTTIPKHAADFIIKHVMWCEKHKTYDWFKDTVAYDFGKTEEGKLKLFDINGSNVNTFIDRIMLNATVDYQAFSGETSALRENVVYGKKLYCFHDGLDQHFKAAVLYGLLGLYAGVAVEIVNVYDVTENQIDDIFREGNGIFVGCKWETFFARVEAQRYGAVYWVQHPILAMLEHKSFYAFLYMLLNFDMAREPLTANWHNKHYAIDQWLIPTYHSSTKLAGVGYRISKAVQGTNADTLMMKDNFLSGTLGLVNNNHTVQQDLIELQSNYPEYRVWLGDELLLPFASMWSTYEGMPYREFSVT